MHQTLLSMSFGKAPKILRLCCPKSFTPWACSFVTQGGLGESSFSTDKRQETWRGLCAWEGPIGFCSVSARLGECFSLFSVKCPGDGSQLRTVSNCYIPMGSRNTSSPGLQSQALKGYPLGCCCKNTWYKTKTKTGYQTYIKAPLQEILACGTWQRESTKMAPTSSSVPPGDALQLANQSPFSIVWELFKLLWPGARKSAFKPFQNALQYHPWV